MKKLENYKLDLSEINGGQRPIIKVRQRNRLFGGTKIVVVYHIDFMDNVRVRTND